MTETDEADYMLAVEQNAKAGWIATVLDSIQTLARTQPTLTTDDVWAYMEWREADRTHEPRAMGAAFKRAARLGMIESAHEFVKSTREKCHHRPIAVWRSRIYAP